LISNFLKAYDYDITKDNMNPWARTFKCLWGPGIDFKEWIPPAYVAWRDGTKTLFLLGAYSLHRLFKNSSSVQHATLQIFKNNVNSFFFSTDNFFMVDTEEVQKFHYFEEEILRAWKYRIKIQPKVFLQLTKVKKLLQFFLEYFAFSPTSSILAYIMHFW
jgi:hypothetical protein